MVALLGLPGAVYLYQGQELALPEVDIDQHQRVDPMWVHSGIGRDGARIPLPWTAGPGNAHGFTTGDDVTPWLPIPDGWGALSVENQDENPDSTLNLLRKAMRERTTLLENGLPADERVTWRHEPNGLVVCDREGGLSVAIAMGDEPVPLPAGTVIVRSDDGTDATLQPDTAAWFWRAG